MAERKKREKKIAEAPVAPAKPRARRKPAEAPAAPAKPRARRKPAEAPAPLPEAPAPLPEAPAAWRTPAPADWPALPVVTGHDHIVAVPIDARSALLYWELTSEGLTRARASLGGAEHGVELILRLYLIGRGDETEIRDAPVGVWLGHRRISFDHDGLRLTAAVGFRAGDGFVGVARSNPVQLPHAGPGSDPVRFVDASGARHPVPAGVETEALRRLSAAELFR